MESRNPVMYGELTLALTSNFLARSTQVAGLGHNLSGLWTSSDTPLPLARGAMRLRLSLTAPAGVGLGRSFTVVCEAGGLGAACDDSAARVDASRRALPPPPAARV